MLNWFHPSEHIAMSLGELRQARGLLTQAKVAARMGISQSAVATFEKRDDVLLSKLREYVQALGGELEITATFRSGHRVRLKQFTADAADRRSTRERAAGRRTVRDTNADERMPRDEGDHERNAHDEAIRSRYGREDLADEGESWTVQR